MGRTSNMSIAAAVAAVGTYQTAQAFVPVLAGSRHSDAQMPSLRGAAPEAASSSAPAVLAGIAGVAATAMRSTRRPATATKEKPAEMTQETEEPAAPPPFDPAQQIGAGAPLGFFDPLNFAKVGDEEGFRKLRIAELKHGRVGMMAAVGAVVQHYVQFPGFEKVPKGIFAVTDGTGLAGFAALFALSGVFELVLWKEKENKPVSSVGDYGNPAQLGIGPPLGLSVEMKSRELENGRAGMVAALGIVLAELLTGKDGMQQLGYQ